MSVAWVQGTSVEAGTLTLNVNAGDCLVVTAGVYGTSVFSVGLFHDVTVTDTQGNVWNQVTLSPSAQALVDFQPHAAQIQSWVAYNCNGGMTSINVNNFSSQAVYTVDEYSGVAHVRAVDGVNMNSTAIGSMATSISSGDITALPGEMIYSAAFCNGASYTFTPTGGFNARQLINTGHDSLASFDQISSGGTVSNSTSISGGTPETIHTIIFALSPTTIPGLVLQAASNSFANVHNGQLSVTMPSSTTAGNLLIARIRIYEETIPALDDSQGNTWTIINCDETDSLYTAYTIAKSGALTVNLNASGGGDDVSYLMTITEFNFPNPYFTTSSGAYTNSVMSQSTGTITANTNDLLISSMLGFIPAPPPSIDQGVYETLQNSDCGLFGVDASYLVGTHYIVPAPGSYETTFTVPATDNLHAMILGFHTIPAATYCKAPCGKLQNFELTRDLDADWDDRSTLLITQDVPLPFTLRGLVLRMSFNQD